MKIQPIVEGHGDVAAVPRLLRRFVDLSQTWEVEISRPIRWGRGRLVRKDLLEQVVKLALAQPADAILILFDGDKDCPAEWGPRVHRWAAAVARGTPCQVVMPHREYEAWFLAAIESLRGHRGLRQDAEPHPNPEEPRGAKKRLEERMHKDRSYLETTDQPALSARFSMAAAHARCRSFRKLTSAFGALLRDTGHDIDPWPPRDWLEQS